MLIGKFVFISCLSNWMHGRSQLPVTFFIFVGIDFMEVARFDGSDMQWIDWFSFDLALLTQIVFFTRNSVHFPSVDGGRGRVQCIFGDIWHIVDIQCSAQLSCFYSMFSFFHVVDVNFEAVV